MAPGGFAAKLKGNQATRLTRLGWLVSVGFAARVPDPSTRRPTGPAARPGRAVPPVFTAQARRRTTPARPNRPVASSASDAGSGTSIEKPMTSEGTD